MDRGVEGYTEYDEPKEEDNDHDDCEASDVVNALEFIRKAGVEEISADALAEVCEFLKNTDVDPRTLEIAAVFGEEVSRGSPTFNDDTAEAAELEDLYRFSNLYYPDGERLTKRKSSRFLRELEINDSDLLTPQ